MAGKLAANVVPIPTVRRREKRRKPAGMALRAYGVPRRVAVTLRGCREERAPITTI